MLNKKMITLMCLALVAAMSGSAFAQKGQGLRGAGNDGAGLFPGCPVNLNLTAEQTAKIQDGRTAFFKDTAGLRSDIFKKKQDLDVLMLEPTVDAVKAKKLQEEIYALKGQMAQKRLQAQLDARAVLTPEQIKLLPPGCNMGIGRGGRGMGRGCDKGFSGGRGQGRGRGYDGDGW